MIWLMIRKTILEELERKGWSRYRLVQSLQGKMPPSTVYQYLSGQTDLNSRRVSMILDALGMKHVPPAGYKPAEK